MARPRSNKIIWFFLDYRENEREMNEKRVRERKACSGREKKRVPGCGPVGHDSDHNHPRDTPKGTEFGMCLSVLNTSCSLVCDLAEYPVPLTEE